MQDYITGLKALLYLKSNPPPSQPHLWSGQSPPPFKHQKGKPVIPLVGEDGLVNIFHSSNTALQIEIIRKKQQISLIFFIAILALGQFWCAKEGTRRESGAIDEGKGSNLEIERE